MRRYEIHTFTVHTYGKRIHGNYLLLDQAVYHFSLTYIKSHQNMLINAKNAFLELPVPVVPLLKGIGILPLIGHIDTAIADQLFNGRDALALIGVETVITGIRPEVAQTMISIGFNIAGLHVKANLHQAFEDIRLLKSEQASADKKRWNSELDRG